MVMIWLIPILILLVIAYYYFFDRRTMMHELGYLGVVGKSGSYYGVGKFEGIGYAGKKTK